MTTLRPLIPDDSWPTAFEEQLAEELDAYQDESDRVLALDAESRDEEARYRANEKARHRGVAEQERMSR